jgi:16S rRNA (cytidine1402-2'-O)-methyltransferase
MKPCLTLVCTPIGNFKDLSERGRQTIQSASLVIGEEFTNTSKLLKKLDTPQDFELLNEHSTTEDIRRLVTKIKSNSLTCLFSDGGTPLLEDPGLELVRECIKEGIEIKVAPGASAFLIALLLSGFSTSPFTFIGFLPRESGERIERMKRFLSLKHTLILYETPYRYKKAFREILPLLKKETRVFLGLNLTGEDEVIFRGNCGDLLKKLEDLPKANPVLVLSN